MSVSGIDIDAIDWRRPWLDPYRVQGLRVAARLADGASVAQALNAEPGRPRLACGRELMFVSDSPGSEAYEAFIARTAQVPTRDNLHDFFNGLVWLAFPTLKAHLNRLQAGQIAEAGIGGTRGAVRDALTLFDENALLFQAPGSLQDALRRRDWRGLFVDRRGDWPQARVTLFGHALLEKLVRPRKAITAHAWLLPAAVEGAGLADHLAAHLTPEVLASKSHCPLPVLGVPGWWPDNASPTFYDDPAVFRPKRR